MTQQRVLVTGGSGFVAGHCILHLLDQGYDVRTTVRSASGVLPSADLTVVTADLLSDDGWADAVDGVDFVLHVASPVRLGPVDDENDVIAPALDGTVRVLRAAKEAGVRRVVLTSAFHAAGFGHPPTDHTFTEEDWSVVDGPGMDAYGRAKTLAERAAWDFAAGGPMELVTLLPVAVMGPILGGQITGANHILRELLEGRVPGSPGMWIPVVDVRDVAGAHVAAMTEGAAAGHRFLLSSGPAMTVREIGGLLRDHLAESAPEVAARIGALFSSEDGETERAKRVSSEKARRVLGWRPRASEEAVRAGADSMIESAAKRSDVS
ncbi:NAD-dependent epimerase/dehydratase family protein [Herbidospora daliensis]|uniref:NAD-dependent epimerase/dehydratase family protein n=1 Tax=Herbidospora daliensis TaxID=295585 RepID=UPI000783DA7C|nr:NAD-dependent epimerase/dehydratase family protein [Herbidospora daliensis]